MFSNFIYFIIVVLIYGTYQPSGEPNFSGPPTLLLFFLLTGLFTFLTWLQFKRIAAPDAHTRLLQLDDQFNSTVKRQSILAIVVFALDIYGLNLTAFLSGFPLFSAVPTLQALLFLGLFIFYLSIVWAFAHRVYCRIYLTDISRRDYILSNISFSVPVLIPWLLLSGVADLIQALPFDALKRFLSTTGGEALYFFTFLFAIALTGPAIIQKFWRCEPLEPGLIRSRIEALCRKAGLAYNDILYWPIFGGKMITAGVMGLVQRFRYILVTRALLKVLTPEELDAVIAHEIGHVKKNHLLFYLFFFGGYMLLSYATFDLMLLSIFYVEPLYRIFIDIGVNQATFLSVLMSLMLITLFVIYFRYIFGYFMRNFERQADTYVYALSESARPLIATLEKISLTSGQSPDRPNWHHFSISERIDYLTKCEADRGWIERHDRKLRKSIAVYLAGFIAVCSLAYTLNFGGAGQRINAHFLETFVERELERTPHNPDLYSLLGDLYYNRSRFRDAAQAYENSLRLRADNPRVLNNLAWLYATCEDPVVRRPEQAVRLAERAAALEKAPHIWDTLAESYYVAGEYKKAVAASRQALALTRSNRTYYEQQLTKFTQALSRRERGI